MLAVDDRAPEPEPNLAPAAALLAALERHYTPTSGRRGGIFIPECGLNLGFGSGSRCDAVHVGFTSTSGRILRGHEIKVSRADWLTELGKHHKASVWADTCHEFWLVTPLASIVHPGELPPGWGHMVPGRGRRMSVVQQATSKGDDHDPSWLVVRSIMARADTILANEQHAAITAARATIEAEYQQRLQARVADLHPISAEDRSRLDSLTRLERRLGAHLNDWEREPFLSPTRFADALRIAEAMDSLLHHWSGLAATSKKLREHATLLEDVAALLGEAPIDRTQ